eukprot:243328-Pelagomonas_calceolata.AAC.3
MSSEVKWEVSYGCMPGSQCHAQGCGQQGVWRQTCSKSIQTSKVVAMYDVSLLVKSRGQFLDLQSCCGCLEGQ